MRMLAQRPITHIVIHTSASYSGGRILDPSAKDIDRWHRAKGWRSIGYHYVVRRDGSIEVGRDVRLVGAHVAGFNRTTIGVCFTGHGDYAPFTMAQMRAGAKLVADLIGINGLEAKFRANPMRVLGHAEVGKFRQALSKMIGSKIPDPNKSCPGKKVDMSLFRVAVLEAIGK